MIGLVASAAIAIAPGCSLVTHFEEFRGPDDDGGGGLDGGRVDSGVRDGGGVDGDLPDAGMLDASMRDGGRPDGGGGLELVVSKTGTGTGTVVADMGTIACGASCSGFYASGTIVTLTASADPTSTFAGWSGDCAGTAATCMVTVDRMRSVGATFTLRTFTVTVSRAGDGGGAVASDDMTIRCDGAAGEVCSMSYPSGTALTLTATPSMGAVFGGWSGACTGTGTCMLTVDADRSVTASFDRDRRTLGVSVTGTGSGNVTSAPAGIDCGTDCSESYTVGAMVTLTASASADSTFGGWTGACTGMSATCMVTMDMARSVTATFTLRRHTLDVVKTGSGTGTVLALLPPGAINCGATCSTTQDHGTMVTLSATADGSSSFAGWSGGGCTGTGTCTVTLDGAQMVTAAFNLVPRMLTVTPTGSGTVTSAPAGIDCGATCGASFGHGATVMLTATPAIGQRFVSWGGACSGSMPTCSVSMTTDRSVTAMFAPLTYTLTVALGGDGAGSVSSSPPGITCGADCSESYTHGTMVTLTPTANAGSSFGGWGGACSGSGACVVTMDMVQNVTASFFLGSVFLTVARAGAGTGTVTSMPIGIDCGADCTEAYTFGTNVTLTATPSAGSTFGGWSGACTGMSTTCVVMVTSATNVTATFTPIPRTMTVTRSGSGTGSVSSSPMGITCGSDCSEAYGHGTMVTLTATADASSTFTGWSGGGCSGTTPCTVTMDMDRSVVATFTLRTYSVDVTRSGGGTGSVSSTPSGITCGTDCSEPYTHGTALMLTATAGVGSSFGGWTGVAG